MGPQTWWRWSWWRMEKVSFIDLRDFARADWDSVFSYLTCDMDPWAVDLVELVRRFREYLKGLEALELEIPGRMLHAGAVLLRMKAEWIRDRDREPPTLEEVVEEVAAEAPVAEDVYIAPELRLPLLRRPKARTSIAELRRALQAALAQGARRRNGHRDLGVDDIGMDLAAEPFSRRTLRLLKKLLSLVNGNRVIPFRKLLKRRDPAEQVARFMELLHLDAEGKVRVFQEEFLGEVLIEVPHETEGAG